jgi:plastocyanin
MDMGRIGYLIVGALASSFVAGCTPGALAPNAANGPVSGAMTVGESLVKYGQMSSKYGMVGGFHPAIVIVARGTPIQFHNEDSFNHTGSSISGMTFPSGNPIMSSAQKQHGTDVSQPGWSTGVLVGNAFSVPFGTSQIGTYLFGCFYHYPLMAGVVIVQ